MITGATHIVSADLMKSVQDFRAQLEQQRNVNTKESSELQDVGEATEPTGELEATVPTDELEAPQESAEAKIDYDALNEGMQSRRDSARQAAVHVATLQHQKNMVDTYMNASSDNDSSSDSMNIDPVDVYKKSMDYSRNMALIKAFETVSSELSDRSHVSILV